MSRAIKIETIRVGDVHPGDVLRFTHPLDRGSNARKSNWLLVTEVKLTQANKVNVSFSAGPGSTKVFPSPYELVEVQVAYGPHGPRRLTPEETEQVAQHADDDEVPEAPEWHQKWYVKGHWRRDCDGNMTWVPPQSKGNPADEEASFSPFEARHEGPPAGQQLGIVPGHWRELEDETMVWIEPYPLPVNPENAENEIAAAMAGDQELYDLKFDDITAAMQDDDDNPEEEEAS